MHHPQPPARPRLPVVRAPPRAAPEEEDMYANNRRTRYDAGLASASTRVRGRRVHHHQALRSGRVAWQFVQELAGRLGVKLATSKANAAPS